MTKVYCDDVSCSFYNDGVCSNEEICIEFIFYKDRDGYIYHSDVNVICKRRHK